MKLVSPAPKPIRKILIVDDDATIRDAIRLALEEQDYLTFQFTECASVTAGIQKMKQAKPDIVILDLHMPDKTGFDFMKIMKNNNQLAQTKVIMLTADDTIGNILQAEHTGINAFHFLAKPFNISDLQALVLSLSLPLKM